MGSTRRRRTPVTVASTRAGGGQLPPLPQETRKVVLRIRISGSDSYPDPVPDSDPASRRRVAKLLRTNRQTVNPLARRGVHRIHQRASRERRARFADTAWRFRARDDVDVDLRHLVVTHHLVVIEVPLLDASVLDRDF